MALWALNRITKYLFILSLLHVLIIHVLNVTVYIIFIHLVKFVCNFVFIFSTYANMDIGLLLPLAVDQQEMIIGLKFFV